MLTNDLGGQAQQTDRHGQPQFLGLLIIDPQRHRGSGHGNGARRDAFEDLFSRTSGQFTGFDIIGNVADDSPRLYPSSHATDIWYIVFFRKLAD